MLLEEGTVSRRGLKTHLEAEPGRTDQRGQRDPPLAPSSNLHDPPPTGPTVSLERDKIQTLKVQHIRLFMPALKGFHPDAFLNSEICI